MKKKLIMALLVVGMMAACAGKTDEQVPVAAIIPENVDSRTSQLDEAIEKNPDTVAWLTVPGTNIDGPVQQAEDNEYYLRRDELGDPSHEGCFFADYECSFDGALSTNTIIYGHTFTAPGQDPNIGFGQLNAFLDAEFAAENTQIFLSVADRQYAFRIKSVGVASAEQGVCILAGPNWAQQQELVRLANERNVLEDRALEAVGGQKLLTLSTCTGDNTERLLVVAELILPEQEGQEDG